MQQPPKHFVSRRGADLFKLWNGEKKDASSRSLNLARPCKKIVRLAQSDSNPIDERQSRGGSHAYVHLALQGQELSSASSPGHSSAEIVGVAEIPRDEIQ